MYHEDDYVRDAFASAALTGLLAFTRDNARQYCPEDAAVEAYDFADAMMAERKRRIFPTPSEG